MKIKRILSFIIALAIIITSVPVLGTAKKASAHTCEIDGVTYEFNIIDGVDDVYASNVHIVSGTVTLENGTYKMPTEMTKGKNSYPVYSVCGNADGSDFFGTADFANDENVTNIVLPETVGEIGEKAFINRPALSAMTLGVNVKKLDASAFYSIGRTVNFTLTVENPNLVIEGGSSLGKKYTVKGYENSTAHDTFVTNFEALSGTSYKIGLAPLNEVKIDKSNTYKYADDVNAGLFITYLYYVKGVTTDVKFTMPEIVGDKVTTTYDGYYYSINNKDFFKIVDIDGSIIASNLPSSSANISVEPRPEYKTFNITYHMADDTTVNGTYTYSTKKTDLKQTDTKLGYTFKGWSTKKGDADSLVTVGTMLNENMAGDLDLYPIFEANEYKVRFSVNNKVSTYEYTFKYGEFDSAKLKSLWIGKASADFKGMLIEDWKCESQTFTDLEYLSQEFIAKNAVNGVLTLQGSASNIPYTISFSAGKGYSFKTTPNAITYYYVKGTTTELPTVKEDTGKYDFNGWYCDELGNIGTTWNNGLLAKNITLTASWKVHESGVTFDANGGTFKDGTDLRVVSIPVDEKISVNYVPSPAPTKKYCTFLGYSTNKDAKIPDKEIVAKDNLTVYAVWQKKTVTYRFNIFNSDLNANYGSIAFKKGDKVVSASNPEEILIEQTVGEKIITPFDKESGWTYTDNGFPPVVPYGYEVRVGASMTTYTTTAVKNAIVEDYTGNAPTVYVSVTWKTNAHKITLKTGEGAFSNGAKELTIDAVVGTPLKDIMYGGEYEGTNDYTNGMKKEYIPIKEGYIFIGWKNETSGEMISPDEYFGATADAIWIAVYTSQAGENIEDEHMISEENHPVVSASKVTKNGITYKVSGSGAIVSKVSKKSGKVIIPDSIKIGSKKYKVKKINNNVLKNKKITSVTIGKNVRSIGSGAFTNCKKLKNVTIKSKYVKFGKNCFKGLHAKATIKTTSKAQVKKVKKASVGYKKTMKVK